MSNLLEILMFICVLSFPGPAHSARQCYLCSTTLSPDCANLRQNIANLCTATTSQEVNCVKYVYRFGEENVTYRGCKRQNTSCEDIRREKKTLVDCNLCSTNLCNSVPPNASSINVLFALLFVTFIVS